MTDENFHTFTDPEIPGLCVQRWDFGEDIWYSAVLPEGFERAELVLWFESNRELFPYKFWERDLRRPEVNQELLPDPRPGDRVVWFWQPDDGYYRWIREVGQRPNYDLGVMVTVIEYPDGFQFVVDRKPDVPEHEFRRWIAESTDLPSIWRLPEWRPDPSAGWPLPITFTIEEPGTTREYRWENTWPPGEPDQG